MPRSLGFLLVLFSLPASAAIVSGPEIEVTTRILEPPAFGQSRPRMATDGRDFLAVFVADGSFSSNIHAVRIAGDGTPIDTTPLVIADTQRNEIHPDVAWDGARYLVVWELENDAVFARFVEPSGAMTETFRVTEQRQYSNPSHRPRVAFNGRVYFVVWTHGGTGTTDPRAKIIDPSGTVTRQFFFAGFDSWYEHAVAAVGDDFYVAMPLPDYNLPPVHAGWVASVGLFRIDKRGVVSERIVVAPPDGYVTDLHLVSRGEEALLAWTSMRDEGNTIRTARVTASGVSEVQSFGAGSGRLDTVVADGSDFLLIHGDATSRFARRPGSASVTALPMTTSSRVAAAAESILLVQHGINLYVQRFGESAMRPLQLAPRHQTGPAVAALGSIRLAVWMEWNASERRYRIMAARIGADGDALDPSGIDLSATLGDLGHVSRVAAGPDQWLVILKDTDRIRGVRIALDGTVLDESPFVIAEQVHYGYQIDVAWDGSRYNVVYTRGAPSRFGGLWTVFATRVSAEGTVEGPDIWLSSSGGNFNPVIAAGSEGSLIVWVNTTGGTVNGALLDRSGAVVPLGAFPRHAAVRSEIAVAWNGTSFLVAANHFDHTIRFYGVTAGGTATLGPDLATLPMPFGFTQRIELEPHGDGFLLAHANELSATITAAVINRDLWVVHGPQVVASLTPLDSRFGLAGTMLLYGRGIDPIRPKLTRIVVKQLNIEPNPPKRRAAR